jgi:hypothetical protein
MPVPLDAADAIELAGLLEFLADWWAVTIPATSAVALARAGR